MYYLCTEAAGWSAQTISHSIPPINCSNTRSPHVIAHSTTHSLCHYHWHSFPRHRFGYLSIFYFLNLPWLVETSLVNTSKYDKNRTLSCQLELSKSFNQMCFLRLIWSHLSRFPWSENLQMWQQPEGVSKVSWSRSSRFETGPRCFYIKIMWSCRPRCEKWKEECHAAPWDALEDVGTRWDHEKLRANRTEVWLHCHHAGGPGRHTRHLQSCRCPQCSATVQVGRRGSPHVLSQARVACDKLINWQLAGGVASFFLSWHLLQTSVLGQVWTWGLPPKRQFPLIITHIYIYTIYSLCIFTYIYTYVYIYICIYLCIYIYIYVCIYVYVYIYVYIYVYMYMYIFMYIYICIYVY
jgi:hypothetical protein